MAAHNFKDLSKRRYGFMYVLFYEGVNKHQKSMFCCLCARCGAIKHNVIGSNLISGGTKTCGCVKELNGSGLKDWHRAAQPSDYHTWKGGVTSEYEQVRKSKIYTDWRTQVFERDTYTCQKCGQSPSGKLNAHHIEAFAGNPELRTDISNGITFCKVCHKDFHHQHGMNSTEKYVQLFLGEV